MKVGVIMEKDKRLLYFELENHIYKIQPRTILNII